MKSKTNIRTLAQVRTYVIKVGLCLVFPDEKLARPNLGYMIDLPEENREIKVGKGQKVSAIWRWKNQLTDDYPDEIFCGKGAK